jgi:hypothetical protein
MAIIKYTQSNFTAGELDPKTYTRFDYDGYLKGAKKMSNLTPVPQGGFTNRFGQKYVDTCTATDYTQTQIDALIYNDNSIYLLLWEDDNLNIYLENNLIASVATTVYKAADIVNIYPTQLTNRLVTTDGNHRPQLLIRSNNAVNVITAFDGTDDTLTLTTGLATAFPYPASFSNAGGGLPATSPQIYENREYFVKEFAAGEIRIYSTVEDANAGTNYYQVTSAGTGTNNLILHNTWTISNYPIDIYPTIEVASVSVETNTQYDANTFVLSAGSGSGVTCTTVGAAAVFQDYTIGGVFTWAGGVLRIESVDGTKKIATGFVEIAFPTPATIDGIYVTVERPAWSDTLGWPRACGVYQNRVVFGGTFTFPNGVWLSGVDDYANFNDTDATEDAGPIAFYPSDGSMSFIRAITSAKTLMIHTNTGTYSSAVGTETPITPRNFTLTQQNNDGISDIIPVFTDNQIMYVDKSGNNVKNMVFDLVQGIFTLDNISVASNHLVTHPYDMDSFSQPARTDGNFVLFMNNDGSVANLLTLRAQEIAGWSRYTTTQTYQDAYYRQVACAINRCWFIVERARVTNGTIQAISDAFLDNNTWVSAAHGMTVGTLTYVKITTSSSIVSTTPQIVDTGYYWCLPTDATSFQLFYTYADALANTNVIVINAEVTPALGMSVTPQSFATKLVIEEVDFDINTDNSKIYTGVSSATLTGLSHLEGETVQVMGDDILYPDLQVRGGQVVLSESVTDAYVGMGFTCRFKPLDINTPLGAYGNTFYTPKQIKKLYIQYYQTVAGTVNVGAIQSPIINTWVLGEPYEPEDGVCEYSPMTGWTDQEIEIVQDKPLPITIIGLGYILEDG